jgi:hypothetical protein
MGPWLLMYDFTVRFWERWLYVSRAMVEGMFDSVGGDA